MTPCQNCGSKEYSKLYIIGKSYEDAQVKNEIYCNKCIESRAEEAKKGKKSKKLLGINIRGTSK